MSRIYYIIFFIFITITLKGQHEIEDVDVTSDSTLMSNEDLIYAANTIQSQADSISKLSKLNVQYKNAIDISENVINLSNLQISLKDKQLDIYRNVIADITPYKSKQKWYDKKWIHFVYGAATIYLASVVVSKIE